MNNNFFGQYYTWISIFAFFGSLRGMCPLKKFQIASTYDANVESQISTIICFGVMWIVDTQTERTTKSVNFRFRGSQSVQIHQNLHFKKLSQNNTLSTVQE